MSNNPISSLVQTKEPKDTLIDLLRETGTVSIKKLKSKLREANHANVDQIVEELSAMNSRWKKIGRSFCTPEKYEQVKAEQSEELQEQGASEELPDDEQREDTAEKPNKKAKEKRLCDSYLLPFLRSLYYTDLNNDNEVAFCVQGERPSGQFRNVDLIATYWRDQETAELVTVEAKLRFNAQVVQQAANYSRFSHRVWIAVVVETGIEVEEIIPSLREEDPLLFEYVLSLGLGVIACQPGRGGSYDCYPVQWPRKQEPDSYEKQTFLEDYRDTFERAGLLQGAKRIGKVA